MQATRRGGCPRARSKQHKADFHWRLRVAAQFSPLTTPARHSQQMRWQLIDLLEDHALSARLIQKGDAANVLRMASPFKHPKTSVFHPRQCLWIAREVMHAQVSRICRQERRWRLDVNESHASVAHQGPAALDRLVGCEVYDRFCNCGLDQRAGPYRERPHKAAHACDGKPRTRRPAQISRVTGKPNNEFGIQTWPPAFAAPSVPTWGGTSVLPSLRSR